MIVGIEEKHNEAMSLGYEGYVKTIEANNNFGREQSAKRFTGIRRITKEQALEDARALRAQMQSEVLVA